ncbi:MAG: ornithine cyclodeaminase family protein [Cyclobacteriaceae bacterium]
MSDFKILRESDIEARMDMATAIDLMRDAFVQISARSANVPVRTAMDDAKQRGRVLFMPAYSPGYHLFGLKMVSVFPDNVKKGEPSIQGKMLVMDDETGTPLGLLDAENLTAIRTGAASGLATDLLAHPDSNVLAIFGTGAQSKTQVAAILKVRPIEEVLVFGTSKEKAQAFCDEMSTVHKAQFSVGSPTDLKRADIICTATTSTTPVFELEQLKPGVHINGIGSYKPSIREIPPQVIAKSLLVVDQREAALSEAGDIVLAMEEGAIAADHIYAELGELVSGAKKGRTSDTQITVFKSVGNAVQDLALAAYLLK